MVYRLGTRLRAADYQPPQAETVDSSTSSIHSLVSPVRLTLAAWTCAASETTWAPARFSSPSPQASPFIASPGRERAAEAQHDRKAGARRALTSGQIEMLDNDTMKQQFAGLQRRTGA